MASAGARPKLLVIVGPTASGKSDLAMKVAEEFNGEIISADSRIVYKGMNIGTAKPTATEQKAVRHWGLDVVEPGERFTAAQFKKYAKTAIADIQKRGKSPILVGGTGLYIDSVIFDFGFRQDADLDWRKKLEAMNIQVLQAFISEMSWPMPFNFKNKRHLIRTIETKGRAGSRNRQVPKEVIIAGLWPADKDIKQAIGRRVDQNFETLVKETRQLLAKYGAKKLLSTAGIAYKSSLDFIEGQMPAELAKEHIKKAEWQYARRQKTWFKRNKFIHWFDSVEQAYSYISVQLNASRT